MAYRLHSWLDNWTIARPSRGGGLGLGRGEVQRRLPGSCSLQPVTCRWMGWHASAAAGVRASAEIQRCRNPHQGLSLKPVIGLHSSVVLRSRASRIPSVWSVDFSLGEGGGSRRKSPIAGYILFSPPGLRIDVLYSVSQSILAAVSDDPKPNRFVRGWHCCMLCDKGVLEGRSPGIPVEH